MESKKSYVVDYNGWLIHVKAQTEKAAKYRAWMKFKEAYPTDFIDFVRTATVAEDWSEYNA